MRYLNYWDNKNFWGAKSGPLTHAWAVNNNIFPTPVENSVKFILKFTYSLACSALSASKFIFAPCLCFCLCPCPCPWACPCGCSGCCCCGCWKSVGSWNLIAIIYCKNICAWVKDFKTNTYKSYLNSRLTVFLSWRHSRSKIITLN